METVLGSWGNEYPGAHGLTLHDENGEEFLYITDYERHQVIKTQLDGRVVQTFDWPADTGRYTDKNEFHPTETAIAPNGDVFVADGYGKDYVVQYSPKGVCETCFWRAWFKKCPWYCAGHTEIKTPLAGW